MKRAILAITAPLLLSLASTQAGASEKSGCLFFCGRTEAPAQTAARPQNAQSAPEAAYDLDAAIAEAQAQRKAGKLNEAATILSQLVLFSPDDPRVLGEYGKTLAALGRSDDALAFLERAVQLNTSDYSLYSAQGIAYDQKGDYGLAKEAYARALALKPGDPAVLNNAALSHMQSGDLAGAKALLEQAAPATKDFPRIAENLAMVQRLLAARPEAAPAAPQPVPENVSPPAPEPVPSPPSGPVRVGETPPEQSPPPVQSPPRALTAPPVETLALMEPKPVVPPVATSAFETLKADPSVRMAPIPKEEPAPLSSKPKASFAEKPVAVAAAKQAAPQVPARASAYYVQAGAYATEDRATRLAQTLGPLGARVAPTTIAGKPVYRVRLGPFLDAEQANTAISEAKGMVEGNLLIVTE